MYRKVSFSPACAMRSIPALLALGVAGPAMAGNIWYVSTKGQDLNSGSSTSEPVSSVGRALGNAQSGDEIRIAQGKYIEANALLVPANLTLTGGWSESFGNRMLLADMDSREVDATPPPQCGVGNSCITTQTADRVITIKLPGVKLSHLLVQGPDRSAVVGDSSFGLIVDGANTTLERVQVVVGKGGPGAGASDTVAASGYCTSGGKGHRLNSDCSRANVGSDTGQSVNDVVKGGAAGGDAGQYCPAGGMWNAYDVSDVGGGGYAGADGTQGANALAPAAADTGWFLRRANGELDWSAAPANRGAAGTHGAGGGGGGAGQSYNYNYAFQGESVALGGSGGDGGGGGCGSAGGLGGNSGGGAFGFVIADATATVVGHLALFNGTGGTGGNGGKGGGMTPGAVGSGGAPRGCTGYSPQRCAGNGGPGGAGGKGGAGGGGAGGNGGPAIAIAKVGTGALTGVAASASKATRGKGGTGGAGGQDGNLAASGSDGATYREVQIDLVASSPLSGLSATASSSANGAPASNAVDGNPDTIWNAGTGAPSWIELDLQKVAPVKKIRLLVAQLPAGATNHLIYLGTNSAPTTVVASNAANTSDGQWIEVELANAVQGRYLRVHTASSSSWVAWREIQVYQ
jgi:hypothetical protein